MACCAFAVLLLSQLLLPFRWVWQRLFGTAELQRNDAVAWSPAQQTTVSLKPPARRWKRGLAFVVAAELVLVAGVAAAAGTMSMPTDPAAADSGLMAAINASICSITGQGTGQNKADSR